MLGDDLNAPLGFDAGGAGSKPGRPAMGRLLIGGSALAAAVLGIAVILHDGGHGGEPYARVAIVRAPPATPVAAPAAATDPLPTGTLPQAPSGAALVEEESGVKVIRGGNGQPPGAEVIQLSAPVELHLTPAPDKRLVEKSKYGLLPIVGADGARPADVYASPVFNDGKLAAGAPEIALVIGGVGLAAVPTQSAEALPAAITLALAPYGTNLPDTARAARDAGHELVLQVPMEAFDGSDPGPNTLSTSFDADHNIDRLHWSMGRFTGYVGVANFLGGKFTANETSFTPILHEIAARGLIYLDDGTSAQSLTSQIAGSAGQAWAEADVVIDAVQTPEAIDAALTRLETIARQKGIAVGTGSDLPVTIDSVSRFIARLEARGVALVPLTAALHRPPVASAAAQPAPSIQ